MTVFDILVKYRTGLLHGVAVTLQLCGIVWTMGLIGGTVLGVCGARWRLWIGVPSRVGSFVLSGIPVLVVLFWLYYPLQSIFGVTIDAFYTTAMTLTIINTLAVADTIRGALIEFPSQYSVAARVCGLSARCTLLHVQLPIIARQVIPGLLVLQVMMLQMTLFGSLISVEEIFRVAQRINAEVYQPVEVYSTLAVFFLMICMPLNGLAYWLRIRFTRNLSES